MGPVGKLSPLDHGDRLHQVAFPVGEMSSLDPAREPPEGLVPVIRTG